ncbi:MAG: YfgM family protein [Plesiomonas sp.]|uniref:YfgM family protein n=1 Tax=Plesiomonas sp. TaxID=2486279 RepID=UPI003F2C84CD
MDIYTTEEQQLDTFRQWWKDNGRAVIIGAVLGLGGLYGWRYWQSHQHGNFTAMSAEYEQVQNELNTDNAKTQQEAQTFISANPETSYGVFAALDLSKTLIEKGDFAAAEKQLLWAQANTKDKTLLPMVTLRLARVQLQLGQADQALQSIDKVTDAAWKGKALEIRGDVLLSKGDTAGAKAAYTQALTADANPTLQTMLQMKLNDLSN